MDDLFVTDPCHEKRRIEDTKGGLLRDSYRWILSDPDFRRWCLDPSSPLLWIKGDPGQGKKMLLCGIIDELERIIALGADSGRLTYFFCQAADSRSNTATAVLRGLIYLLVRQQPSLIARVRKESYDLMGKYLFEGPMAFSALSDIFWSILRDLSFQTTYIAIDALDECLEDLPKLLSLIDRVSSSATQAKWLLLCRNVSSISKTLLGDKQAGLSLMNLRAGQISPAIDAYIDEKLSRLKALQDDDLLRGQVRVILHQKARGTFLWVSFVVEELQRTASEHILQVVERIPLGLTTLYDHALGLIERLPGDSRRVASLSFLQLPSHIVRFTWRK